MKIEMLHIGMRVQHPQYGNGVIKSISEHTAEIKFDNGESRTVAPASTELKVVEATAELQSLLVPLDKMISQVVNATIDELGLGRSDSVVEELALRWHHGRLVMHPSDSALQSKEVELEAFFHKIVMMRNNLRVLEQKINTHAKLSEADKVELQQYITRCYGSMTTFNILFKNKEDQFRSR